jgi:tetratricopeptide (TPR) repeat protein
MYINLRQAEKAVPLMEWCADHHPDFFAVLEPYALALLHTGKSGAETVAAVRERFGTLSRTQSFMLGTALYERGFAAEAEEQFRDVLKAQPHSGPARAALVESLLYQRRYAEAAEEATKVPVDDPIAATVVRSELFARLLARDLEATPASLERARLTNLAQHDISLYSAWLAHLRGDRSVGQIPLAAVPLLELMLESLLRVQDFENFELLTELYSQAPLPERERRERLAQMYLRRGFIKSAAREWLAVCNDKPDVHALAGLAHVAMASGQPTNAHVFATQALALDPTNEMLRLLVKTTSEAREA